MIIGTDFMIATASEFSIDLARKLILAPTISLQKFRVSIYSFSVIFRELHCCLIDIEFWFVTLFLVAGLGVWII